MEKLTSAPPSRSRRAASWDTTKVPRTLTRCMRSNASRSKSTIGSRTMTPAVLTTTSTPPNLFPTSSNSPVIVSSSATSPLTAIARTPRSVAAVTASAALSRLPE